MFKIISFDSKVNTRKKFLITSIVNRLKYLYLIAFHKLLHGLVPIIHEVIMPRPPVGAVTCLAGSGGLLLGGGSSATTLNFGASLYNDLPQEIRTLKSTKLFKIAIKDHIFTPKSYNSST